MMAIRLHRTRNAGRRSGFTLMEIMISMAISSMVMVAIAGLQYFSSRSIHELYGQTRTRSSRMQALDQIRFRLCEARVGSITCHGLSQSGIGYYRINFIDPNIGGKTSSFYFVRSARTLYYNRDIDDGIPAVPVVKGPIDITFELQSGGAIVLLRVRSAAEMSHGDIDRQDGETAIYVRNT